MKIQLSSKYKNVKNNVQMVQ